MVRGFKNKKQTRPARARTFLLSALTAAALAAGLGTAGICPAAHAAGYVYQQHVVNAGVLVNGSDPAPYLFYVLNNRPDVRPTDLTLVNPLASASALPSTAAYWEVPLGTVSDSQLAQYNVLYLPASGQTFSPVTNEKLRRFVDNGGQLIVEYGLTAGTPGLFTGTGWTSSGSTSSAGPPAVASGVFLRHPIISQPYLLSAQDILGFGTAISSSITGNAESGNLFSPVLVNVSSQSVVSAAQIGAGQVVVSVLNIGAGCSYDTGATFTHADLYSASALDLKLLANIISWSETHPNENKSSHGNASSTGLASFSEAWQAPPLTAGSSTPSGAAVWGNFVFAVDAGGNLDAFDAYPSENLTGSTTAAATGAETGLSQYPTTPYDAIWSVSVGAGASAPTVAAFKGMNYVFVEKNDGSIVSYNAVTGAPAPFTLTAPALPKNYTAAPYPVLVGTTVINTPSPTYYDGRVYAGQANGTLDVYDLNDGSSVSVPLNPNPPGGEAVTGPPAVGTLSSGDSNVLVAVAPTNFNIYTVLIGARNEPLQSYTPGGVLTGYSIKRQGRYGLNNIFADVSAVPSLVAYDYGGAVPTSFSATAPAPPSPQDPLFTTTAVGSYYTDWDMDFASATTPSAQLNLNYITANSFGGLSSASAAVMSAPAMDRHGNYYYTETQSSNSYLVGVQNAPLPTGVHIKFRFLIPTSALTDADGVSYTTSNLIGYHFVGAPVIDDQDNVYAAATNGTRATVLCFRGDQQVSAVLSAGPAIDLTSASIIQADEDGGTANTILRGPDANIGTSTATYGQYIASTSSITFYNFFNPNNRGGSQQQIAGDLTEPQPLTATDTTGVVAAPTSPNMQMRTNLAWYVTPFSATVNNIKGLSLVGSSVFLSDGTALYRLSTSPQVGANKQVAAAPGVTVLGAGTVGAAPSVGGNVMVINSSSGIMALTRQVTVIADSGRVLGVDGDGGAVWAVDATTRTDTASGVSTKVAFSHPTALSQFALNDYLVADTGNNRCVRFDPGGNVQWELTRFQDPQGLMASGQPLTLSQPTSVVVRQVTFPSGTYSGDTATYYLIADSGNDRVLEVADIVDPNGAIVANHVLTWVSHTGDRDGRHYRYGSAAYYPNTTVPSGYSIAATVTNTRLGTLTATGLGPISSDAPGGSIVVFNYPASPQPYTSATNDLAYTTSGFYDASGKLYSIRNPRFLQLYTPSASATAPASGVPAFDFLYADDNGAFDFNYDTTKKAFAAGAGHLQFKASDYTGMTSPVFGVPGNPYMRTNLPFVPTCIQPIGNSTTNPRYLITQSYSQGELGTVGTQGKIGGEVFEVDGNTGVGGFGGSTLSHPDLTGPLTQPTYAIRLP